MKSLCGGNISVFCSRRFHDEISTKTIHHAGFFTIILTEYLAEAMITQIFIDCWKLRMLNVNVLRFDIVPDEVNAFTYFPFSSSYCERIESTFLVSMNNYSISLQDHIFPNKLTDFHGCPLWFDLPALKYL